MNEEKYEYVKVGHRLMMPSGIPDKLIFLTSITKEDDKIALHACEELGGIWEPVFSRKLRGEV